MNPTPTVLITGASSGIGAASARLFAARGWQVVATMRAPEAADAALRDDARVLVLPLDVADAASIDAAVRAAITRFGRIDALVNNAGFGLLGLFEATTDADIRRQFDVNVFGLMAMTRAVLPQMRAQGGGSIVNVSSGAGIVTLPLLSAYCASKFALEGFSEALAYELLSQRIAVRIVEPHGGVSGTQFPARSGREAAANATLPDYDAFLAHAQALFARFMGGPQVSADEVAEVVFEAATDRGARLRYLVGNDSFGRIRARHTLPDQDYVDFMRAAFMPAA